MEIPDTVRSAWFSRLSILTAQPVTGGLSNSCVWRLKAPAKEYCLKAWPDVNMQLQRLHRIQSHLQLLTEANVDFVPRMLGDANGNHYLKAGPWYWEVATWLPGIPDPSECVSGEKRRNAMEALARIHEIWRNHRAVVGTSPGLSERLKILEEVVAKISDFTSSSFRTIEFDSCNRWQADSLEAGTDENLRIDELSSRTVTHLMQSTPRLIDALRELTEPQQLHFVVRDLHAGHVLYCNQTVTGIVDFGASRIDEPLLDLVRLLGSQAPFNRQARYDSLKTYQEIRGKGSLWSSTLGQSKFEKRFAIFDETSALLSSYHWLKWLRIERREFPVPMGQILERWEKLLSRLDAAEW